MDVQKYLNNFFKGTKNPSLHAMKFLMNELGNVQDNLNIIHIAGTNGKGSCSEMMNSILVNAGYKVGKFISPHLINFNERISINNIDISDEGLESLIIELEPVIEKYNNLNDVNITLFELETTMALLYFYRNNVDFVILETGLGGLYDCTNIASPIVSLITSISYDHIDILGNTLEEIAIQKAGIIKENSHTLFFEQDDSINSIFINTCMEKNNILHLIKSEDISEFKYNENFQSFHYKDMKNIEINLKGDSQFKNASLCIECSNLLQDLGYSLNIDNIRNGLKSVIHRGRFEIINTNPLIIYDGAHNESAIHNLKNTINHYYKNYNKTFVISILRTKDYTTMIHLLLENSNATFIFTSGNDEKRFVPKEELYEIAKNYTSSNTLYCKDLNDAINFVIEDTNQNNVTFVVGSFYIYGAVINSIK